MPKYGPTLNALYARVSFRVVCRAGSSGWTLPGIGRVTESSHPVEFRHAAYDAANGVRTPKFPSEMRSSVLLKGRAASSFGTSSGFSPPLHSAGATRETKSLGRIRTCDRASYPRPRPALPSELSSETISGSAGGRFLDALLRCLPNHGTRRPEISRQPPAPLPACSTFTPNHYLQRNAPLVIC